MKNPHNRPELPSKRLRELRDELALRVARLVGSAEKLTTPIPRFTLHQRTAPTAPCPATYEASAIVIAQGRKQVEIGKNILTYDPSRYLLTALDLPIVSRVIEASRDKPCLALELKLDISIVREFLGREEFQMLRPPAENPAMSTGEVTLEFLSAWGRLLYPSEQAHLDFLAVDKRGVYRLADQAAGVSRLTC